MANLKLEAERLSGIGNRLLGVTKRLADNAGTVPSISQVVPDLVEIAQSISVSATGLAGLTGQEINPKLEAERLSGINSQLLEVTKRVAEIAGNVPNSSQVVRDLVGISDDISGSAASIVGI